MKTRDAKATINGEDFRYKKHLIEALKETPEQVVFYCHVTAGNSRDATYTVATLPEDMALLVCGPDPHTSRKWWANVERDATGKVVVRNDR